MNLFVVILMFAISYNRALAETITITVSNARNYGDFYDFSGLPTEFVKGNTYKFQMNSISIDHPFSVGFERKVAGGLTGTGYSAKSGKTDNTWFEVTIPSTYTGSKLRYFCTIHPGMDKEFSIGVVAAETPAPAASNAKCNTHTCPSGQVLKETASATDCGSATCASPADDNACCEPGYLFGLANINLCPDDSPVNIVWAGEHNIQESVSYDCISAGISGPLTFAGSTTLNGDGGFLGKGTRKSINATLLSDWNSVRYFRCSQHCNGARLVVTCDRGDPGADPGGDAAGYAVGYAAGQASVTPEDGVTQADVDAANATGYAAGYAAGQAVGGTDQATNANCVDANSPNALKAAYVQLGQC